MTHPAYLREKAIQMRVERQFTIDEIAERLALSRSTIYYWLRDVPLENRGQRPKATAAQRKGVRAMQRKYQLLRDAAYLEGRESFDQLAVYPTFRDFVALYLAEGCKRNRNRVMVANSDPAVIVVCHRWMGWLTSKKLCYSIAFHADQDVTGLKAFWAQELSIDPDDIYAVRKSNSNQLTARTWRCRYGVVSITTHDTLLRARLQGWIDRLRESWA